MYKNIYRAVDAKGLAVMQSHPDYINILLDIDKQMLDQIIPPFRRWTSICYMKLFVPYAAKEDFAVYLDADTEIVGDISPLFEMTFTEPLAMAKYGDIINSGVIVFNCKKWRETISQKELENRLKSKRFFNDESFLKEYGFEYHILNNEWNTPENANMENAKIIHRMGLIRRMGLIQWT